MAKTKAEVEEILKAYFFERGWGSEFRNHVTNDLMDKLYPRERNHYQMGSWWIEYHQEAARPWKIFVIEHSIKKLRYELTLIGNTGIDLTDDDFQQCLDLRKNNGYKE